MSLRMVRYFLSSVRIFCYMFLFLMRLGFLFLGGGYTANQYVATGMTRGGRNPYLRSPRQGRNAVAEMDEDQLRFEEESQRRYSNQGNQRARISSAHGRYFKCENQNSWIPSSWGETFQYPIPSCNCHNGRLIARCFVTQKSNSNNGRYFFRCGCFGMKECDFFEFVDEWEKNIVNATTR